MLTSEDYIGRRKHLQGYEEGHAQGVKEGRAQANLQTILSLHASTGWSYDDILEKMKVPADERPGYLKLLQQEQ